MKKLSKIIESIWSDIQDRSAGETVRKEDSVNLLDPDDFIAYIRKIYKFDNSPYDVQKYTNGLVGTGVSHIFIPICSCGTKSIKLGAIYFNYNEELVYTHESIKKYIPKLWAKLDQEFDLWDDDPDYKFYTIINPKDKSRKVNNSYVLELLNYICDNLDDTVTPCFFRRTNESIWSDIQDRSAGEVVRKEDEFSSICEFVKDHYFVSFVGMDDIDITDDCIHVPIYKVVGLNAFSAVNIYKDSISFTSIDPNKYRVQSLRKFVTYIKDDINQLFDKIKDTNSPKISTFDGLDHWIDFEIKPKDGKITTKFCEEVIDFVLGNTTDNNSKILKILEKTQNCLNT